MTFLSKSDEVCFDKSSILQTVADLSLINNYNTTFHYKYIIPGSFNPVHDGHIALAEYVRKNCVQSNTSCMSSRLFNENSAQSPFFEISISNVDKPCISACDIYDRALAIQRLGYRVLITNAPTMAAKSLRFKNCCFCIGFDSLVRLVDLKYYNNSTACRDAAFKAIELSGNYFLVFPRAMNTIEITKDQEEYLDKKDSLFVIVENFESVNISSTQLREGK